MDLQGSSARAALVWDDDGAGPNPSALYMGGFFGEAGGKLLNGIGRFDGRSWSILSTGFGGSSGQTCAALAVFDDDGPGPRTTALYAAGQFLQAGGVPANWIARWDGTSWVALGAGLDATGASGFPYAQALCVFDEDGAGSNLPALFVGGYFTSASGVASRVGDARSATWSRSVRGTVLPPRRAPAPTPARADTVARAPYSPLALDSRPRGIRAWARTH